jgi:hypothetical protein
MNLIGRQNSKNFFSLSYSFAFDFLREVKQKKGRSSSKILPLFSALLRALFKQRERERERESGALLEESPCLQNNKRRAKDLRWTWTRALDD